MVGDDVDGGDSMKLEKKGYDADDGINKLDGSKDGEMVGGAVGNTDSAKLEKKG